MYLLILALPFTGALLAGFFGHRLGGAGAARVTTGALALTFLLSANAFFEVALSHSPVLLRLSP